MKLYQSSKPNISEHIKHILDEGELEEGATVRKFRIVQFEGEREVSREAKHYNLDFAELQALEQNVMTMDDWVKELDYFLKMTRKDILNGPGLVSHQEALEHARKEYEAFRERLFIAPTENERAALVHFEQLLLIGKEGNGFLGHLFLGVHCV